MQKTKGGDGFILVMVDHFTKLKKVVKLKRITRLDVEKGFLPHWVFEQGTPKGVLSENGPQFERKLYQKTCRCL